MPDIKIGKKEAASQATTAITDVTIDVANRSNNPALNYMRLKVTKSTNIKKEEDNDRNGVLDNMHPEVAKSRNIKKAGDDDSNEELPDGMLPDSSDEKPTVQRLPSGEIDLTTLTTCKIIRGDNLRGKSISRQYGSVGAFCKRIEKANPYAKLTRDDLRRAWFHCIPLNKDKLDLTYVREQNPDMNDEELAEEVDRQILDVLNQV